MECYAFQMVGVAHAALGAGLEDRLAWHRVSRNVVALAAADGMGSCGRASEAAEVASESALALMLAAAAPEGFGGYGRGLAASAVPPAALSCARNNLVDYAQEVGCSESDLGTTLMAVLYDEAERTLSFAYSGDGGIVCLGSDLARPHLAVAPQACGEGRTHDVLDSDWWRSGTEAGVEAFLVCTDGLLEALLDAGEPSALARDILVAGPGLDAELDRVLASVGGVGEPLVPTSDVNDDRTLFACWSDHLIDELEARRGRAARASGERSFHGWQT